MGCKTAEKPIVTPSQLDVVFIMDSTGSMSPYIENVRTNIKRFVDEITLNSASDVHLGLIEYRDHPPQDHTFVVRTHDFTPSVSIMKSWLDSADAHGGGDKPEAVADALYEATKLSWRPIAVKIGVLIADAPPHGLSPTEDSSFPDGCPKGHDPIELTRELIKIGVTMYTVGCEPPIVPYKDFFMGLAYVTGGQYIPLSDPQRLIDAIIGGAREEISLKAFTKDVEQEILNAKAAGGPINKDQITQNVFSKLRSAGAMSMQLLRNNIPLDEATSGSSKIDGRGPENICTRSGQYDFK
jgi:Mg-chelatase subunit ChlD